MKVVLAGGSGFLGRHLIEELSSIASDVVVLSRSNASVPGARTVAWDGGSGGAWAQELEAAEAVVNYTGAPILTRWTAKNKRRILESRVNSTLAIGKAITEARQPPKTWINGSATGYYGDRGAQLLPETEPPGEGFLAEVCMAWEAAASEFSLPATRLVLLRTGVVLSRQHPPLSLLMRLTKLYMGGSIGDGRAHLPWIPAIDHARLARFCIEHPLSGPVNAVSPEAMTNGEMMALLRHVLHRPWSPPAPPALFKLLALVGFPSETVLASTRAIPAAAAAAGFEWRCPRLAPGMVAESNPDSPLK